MDLGKYLFSTRTHLILNGFHVESRLLTEERKAKLEDFRELMNTQSDMFGDIGSDKWIEVLLTRLYEPTIVTWDDVIDWLKYPESRSFLQDFTPTSPSIPKPTEDVLEPLLPANPNRHEKDMDSEIGTEMHQENLEQSGEEYKISDISLDLDETAVDDIQQKTINLEMKLASEASSHCPQNKPDVVLSENSTVNLQITSQDPSGRLAFIMPYSSGVLHPQVGLNPPALLSTPPHPQLGLNQPALLTALLATPPPNHPPPPVTTNQTGNASGNWILIRPCFSCYLQSETLRQLQEILFHVDQHLASLNQFQNPVFVPIYNYFQQLGLSVRTHAYIFQVKLSSCPSCNAQPHK